MCKKRFSEVIFGKIDGDKANMRQIRTYMRLDPLQFDTLGVRVIEFENGHFVAQRAKWQHPGITSGTEDHQLADAFADRRLQAVIDEPRTGENGIDNAGKSIFPRFDGLRNLLVPVDRVHQPVGRSGKNQTA